MIRFLQRTKYPIIQAPLSGGPSTTQMVVAVGRAGGVGSLGAAYLPLDKLAEDCREIRDKAGDCSININLFAPGLGNQVVKDRDGKIKRMNDYLNKIRVQELGMKQRSVESFDFPDERTHFKKQCDIVCGELGDYRGPKMFSFTFGMVEDTVLDRFRRLGFVVAGTATSVKEARMMDGKVDTIVVQGRQAGGHRGTFIDGPLEDSLIPTDQLIKSIIQDGIQVPLVAAGGVKTGEDVAKLLASGAVAVQVGSAFLTCREAGSQPSYKEVIEAARDKIQAENTPTGSTETTIPIVFTRVFTGRYARAIRNEFIDRMEHEFRDDTDILPFPIQHYLTTDIRRAAIQQGKPHLAHLWIGESASLSQPTSASEIIESLAKYLPPSTSNQRHNV
eukprot:gene3743-4317_t